MKFTLFKLSLDLSCILTFLGLFILFNNTVYAQDSYDYTPLSPSASTLATYVDYPVTHSTGVPNISISLFEIDTKMGKIPFTLSYHVGKVKPSELTGPVGLGWSLMPDLGITRNQRGSEDRTGYYSGSSYSSSTFSNTTPCNTYLNMANDNAGYQPDDFYYSLLTKSGKFLYNLSHGFSTLPYEPIVIERQERKSFTIKDTDGTTYRYGRYAGNSTADLTEYSTASTGENYKLNAWKVTEITSYDGSETIEFSYGNHISHNIVSMLNQYKITRDIHNPSGGSSTSIKRTYFSNTGSANYWQYMKPTGGSSSPPYICSDLNPFDCDYTFNLISYDQTEYDDYGAVKPPLIDGGADEFDPNILKENTVTELPLSEIKFNNGKVVYEYDNNGKLVKLSLYNKTGSLYNLIKYARFYYSNLSSSSLFNYSVGNTYNDMRRYTLDKVEMYDKSDNKINEHLLTYSTRSSSLIPLVQGGHMSDIWGFPYQTDYENALPSFVHNIGIHQFNGQVNVELGVSDFMIYNPTASPITTFSPFNNSIPPLLKTITYPTKGLVEFEFEHNRFKKYSTNDIILAGGFRIKRITYQDPDRDYYPNEYISKLYTYGVDGCGYGEISYFPNSSDFMYDQVFRNSSGQDIVVTTINSTPFKNIHFAGGAAVQYAEVKEVIAATNQSRQVVSTNGYTKYGYILAGLGNVHLPYTPLQYEYRDEWKKHFLDKKSVFNDSENLLLEEEYNYDIEEVDAIPTTVAFQRFFNNYYVNNQVCGTSFFGYNLLGYYGSPVSFINYEITTGKVILKQKIVRENLDGTIITNTTDYNYNDHMMLAETQQSSSENKIIRSELKYPYDYTGNSVLNTMVTKNIIDKVVESKAVEQDPADNTTQDLNTSETIYQNWPNGIVAPQYIKTKKANYSLTTEVEFKSYDDYGNPLEVKKATGPSVTYLWGYNGKYPIAKIENATLSEIETNIGSASNIDENDFNTINNLRSQLPNSMITTYEYEPLIGITKITDSRGQQMTYQYDDFSRLKTVLDNDLKLLEEYAYHYKGQN